jgi:isoleucyl-tRNA synthetase
MAKNASSTETEHIEQVAESINFPATEEQVLAFWKKIDAFQSCLKQSKGRPRYSFYDGPPFATGLPHYGHILAGTIKDVVTRFAYQSGYHVERRFGWDCHGLPIEFEVVCSLFNNSYQILHCFFLYKFSD